MRRTATLALLCSLLVGGAAACSSDDPEVDAGDDTETTEEESTTTEETTPPNDYDPTAFCEAAEEVNLLESPADSVISEEMVEAFDTLAETASPDLAEEMEPILDAIEEMEGMDADDPDVMEDLLALATDEEFLAAGEALMDAVVEECDMEIVDGGPLDFEVDDGTEETDDSDTTAATVDDEDLESGTPNPETVDDLSTDGFKAFVAIQSPDPTWADAIGGSAVSTAGREVDVRVDLDPPATADDALEACEMVVAWVGDVTDELTVVTKADGVEAASFEPGDTACQPV